MLGSSILRSFGPAAIDAYFTDGGAAAEVVRDESSHEGDWDGRRQEGEPLRVAPSSAPSGYRGGGGYVRLRHATLAPSGGCGKGDSVTTSTVSSSCAIAGSSGAAGRSSTDGHSTGASPTTAASKAERLGLHQEAAYRRLLMQETDVEFFTIAERALHERGRLLLWEGCIVERMGLAADASDDRDRLQQLCADDHAATLRLVERRGVGGDELAARAAIEADEGAAMEHLLYREELERLQTAVALDRRDRRASTVVLPEEPLDAAGRLQRDVLLAMAPAPPTQSRMEAYKAARRYRQDVDFRRALDGERAKQAATAREAERRAETAIDVMLREFSATDCVVNAMGVLEQCEVAERTRIVLSRAACAKALQSEHRKYLERCWMGRQYTALEVEEFVERAAIAVDYYFMLTAMTEALEGAARRELVHGVVPAAGSEIESQARRHWLQTHRADNARRDAEEAEGEARDMEARRRYWEWMSGLLHARLGLEREEALDRVQAVVNAERRARQSILELMNMQYPAALKAHLHRQHLLQRLSTTVTWTPETYAAVYLAEAANRGDIAAAARDAHHAITAAEARGCMAARREELANAAVHQFMQQYERSNTAASAVGSPQPPPPAPTTGSPPLTPAVAQ